LKLCINSLKATEEQAALVIQDDINYEATIRQEKNRR